MFVEDLFDRGQGLVIIDQPAGLLVPSPRCGRSQPHPALCFQTHQGHIGRTEAGFASAIDPVCHLAKLSDQLAPQRGLIPHRSGGEAIRKDSAHPSPGDAHGV